jgi:hypothetical protein
MPFHSSNSSLLSSSHREKNTCSQYGWLWGWTAVILICMTAIWLVDGVWSLRYTREIEYRHYPYPKAGSQDCYGRLTSGNGRITIYICWAKYPISPAEYMPEKDRIWLEQERKIKIIPKELNRSANEWMYWSSKSSFKDSAWKEGLCLPKFTKGIEHHGQSGEFESRNIIVVAPHWFLILLSAILPLREYVRYRRRRWIRRCQELCLCIHCGYDLRAHQPGQRCPECGTIKPDSLSAPYRT